MLRPRELSKVQIKEHIQQALQIVLAALVLLFVSAQRGVPVVKKAGRGEIGGEGELCRQYPLTSNEARGDISSTLKTRRRPTGEGSLTVCVLSGRTANQTGVYSKYWEKQNIAAGKR